MSYDIRPLSEQDLNWLRFLRNGCRENFFDTREVTEEGQREWFSNLSKHQDYFIIWEGEERVGCFAFVPVPTDLPLCETDKPLRYLASVMVDPAHRGKGIFQEIKRKLDPETAYMGYVRDGNMGSLKACLKLGFQLKDLYQHPKYGWVFVLLWEAK